MTIKHSARDVLRPASNGDVAVHVPGGPKVDYARLDDEVERVAGMTGRGRSIAGDDRLDHPAERP